MRQFLSLFAASLAFATSASAVMVESAKYDPVNDRLVLDVQYSGGCKEHLFSLEFGACSETYPMQISARVIDHTIDDRCKAIVRETIELGLQGMTGCRPAVLSLDSGSHSFALDIPTKSN